MTPLEAAEKMIALQEKHIAELREVLSNLQKEYKTLWEAVYGPEPIAKLNKK